MHDVNTQEGYAPPLQDLHVCIADSAGGRDRRLQDVHVSALRRTRVWLSAAGGPLVETAQSTLVHSNSQSSSYDYGDVYERPR